MEKPKTYNIDNFQKLCNVVNAENANRLAIDLAQWIIHYALTIQAIRDKFPKETKGKVNTKIAKSSFTWYDDGKNDLLHATIENTQTGEVTIIESADLNSEQEDKRSVASKADSSTDDQNQNL